MKRDKMKYGGTNTGYRIRCMKSCMQQLEEDYNECKRLWKLLERGTINQVEIEALARAIAWIKESIETITAAVVKKNGGAGEGSVFRALSDAKHPQSRKAKRPRSVKTPPQPAKKPKCSPR